MVRDSLLSVANDVILVSLIAFLCAGTTRWMTTRLGYGQMSSWGLGSLLIYRLLFCKTQSRFYTSLSSHSRSAHCASTNIAVKNVPISFMPRASQPQIWLSISAICPPSTTRWPAPNGSGCLPATLAGACPSGCCQTNPSHRRCKQRTPECDAQRSPFFLRVQDPTRVPRGKIPPSVVFR